MSTSNALACPCVVSAFKVRFGASRFVLEIHAIALFLRQIIHAFILSNHHRKELSIDKTRGIKNLPVVVLEVSWGCSKSVALTF
jgi:hypothetical protein